MNNLKPIPLSEAVLMLNGKDFDALADYIIYLRGGYDADVDLNFYRYGSNPGLICICSVGTKEIGKIQLVADKQ